MSKQATIEELEYRIHELTAQLEQAVQVKNMFLTNMSHEIRTPLNGVIAASDLALSEHPSPKVEHYLKIIHTSGIALLEVVNEILDFSKIDKGVLTLEPEPFRIDDVLDSLTERFVDKAFKKRIELLVDIEPGIPKAVLGDAHRLRQVLANLLENAIKFSNKGGVICVGIKKVAVSEGFVVYHFYIKDSGIGIPQEYLDQVFKPFSQADSTASREYAGLGLGMHVSKRLVEMMDGRMGVKSEPCKGSEFFFTARFQRQPQNKEEKYIFPKGLEGLQVLIVDDCADSRSVLKKMLDSFGFQSEEVASGYEAINRLRQVSQEGFFDIIIMDWKMSELNGLETSRIIRCDLKLSLPILIVTAVGREPEKLQAEKLGLEAFLTKPVNAPLLFNTIIDVLGKTALENEKQKKQIATKASIYKKRLLGLRVLVAEDNPTNQDIALAVLKQAGILVEIANNGQEAIELIQQKNFDAVLMDIQMPRMDGIEATRRIRSEQRFTSLPIIAMTAHAMKGDEAQCRRAGMDGYITKPINQDALFYTLWKKTKYKETSHRPVESTISDAATPSSSELPEMLPGIDIRSALSSLNIEKMVFRRILLKFYSNHQDYIANLRRAFDEGDWKMLQALSHSLKGSSANIGANDLHEASHKLERASKEGWAANPSGKALLDQLEKAFNQVLHSIRMISEASDDSLPAISDIHLDKKQLSALFIELKNAIAVADPDKTKRYFGAIKTQLGTAKVENLKSNLDIYEYEAALAELEKIAREIDLTIKEPQR